MLVADLSTNSALALSEKRDRRPHGSRDCRVYSLMLLMLMLMLLFSLFFLLLLVVVFEDFLMMLQVLVHWHGT